MPDDSSPAKAFFDKYTSADAVGFLKAMPITNPATVETEWMDFKSGQPREEDIKGIISKSFAAFANNAGGILIWGLDCRRNEDRVDKVVGLKLASNVDVLRDKLAENYRTYTQPSILGVQFAALPLDKTTKEGFVICYIPAGGHKPYRSLHAKQPYYTRISQINFTNQCYADTLNPHKQRL